MPLIICPECNAEISSAATSCPKCGYPMEDKRSFRGLDEFVVITFVGLSLIFLSTFMTWIRFGPAGLRGIDGIGELHLLLTLVVSAGLALSLRSSRWYSLALLVASGWGTIAGLWAVGKICSLVFGSNPAPDVPFLAMLQPGAGPGLYVAAAGGFLTLWAASVAALRALRPEKRAWCYYTVQLAAVALAAVLLVRMASKDSTGGMSDVFRALGQEMKPPDQYVIPDMDLLRRD